MSLFEQIRNEYNNARKERDEFKQSVLVVLLGDLQNDEKRSGVELSDQYVIQKVKKAIEVANENDSITHDNKFRREAELLEQFIPKQLSEQELTDIIQGIIDEARQSGDANIGTVMKALKADCDGLYDGKLASGIVKQLLN